MADQLDLEPVESQELDLEPLDLEPVDQEPEEKIGLTESAVRGAGQGLTLGFADELAGGLQAGLDVATSDKKLSDLKQLYQTYKQLQQEREQKAQEQNPKTYLGSDIAGSVVSSMLPGGQAATAGKAAKLGAIMGLGRSKADLTKGEVGQAALDTALGAGLGYAGGKGGEYIGKGLSKLGAGSPLKATGEKLSTGAEDIALSTLGTNKKILENEVGQSIFTPAEFRKGIGREILDTRGVLDSPVDLKVKLADKIRNIEAEKAPLLESSNKKLQELVTAGKSTGESLKDKLTGIKDKMIQREAQTATNIDSVNNLDKQLTETVNRYASNDGDIVKLNEFKKLLNKKLTDTEFSKTPSDLPQETEYIREAITSVNKRLQELADLAEPGAGKLVKEMGRKENILYDSANLARQAQIKELGKESKWGLMDIIGSQLDKAKIGAAKGIDAYGKRLQKAGEYVESATPGAALARPVLQDQKEKNLDNSKPVNLSRNIYDADDNQLNAVSEQLLSNPKFVTFGETLKKSLEEKSTEKKNAVLFTMMQNPEIRKLIQGQENE